MLDRPSECDLCHVALESRSITHEVLMGQERFDIENVPVLECPQCGQRWISPEAQVVIDEILRANEP